MSCMAKKIINKAVKNFLSLRYRRIESIRKYPHLLQHKILKQLVAKAADTVWGKTHDFNLIKTRSDFQKAMPLQDYETHKPFIKRMMLGEEDVLWPGKVKWYAKSSGTTSCESKFIPVSKDKLKNTHQSCGWDALSIYYHEVPDARIFADKTLLIGGSLYSYGANPEVTIGDVSAIMIHHLPLIGRPFFTPDFQSALLDDWELKIDRILQSCLNQDVTLIGGVPTWIVALFNAILEKTGKSNIHEVWPNLTGYFHGGVGFSPYIDQFNDFLPGQVNYMEVYNASEGYFAVSDRLGRDDMLLLVDNGIYYEFVPVEDIHELNPRVHTLHEVELGVNYALVISTCSGLWRYMPGDTIKFSTISPYRIKITGRIKQHINAFGEELIIENTDKAIAEAAMMSQSRVNEYTVAPIFLNKKGKGGHQWLIEFEKEPLNIDSFQYKLDQQLKMINSDYLAKRQKNITLQLPQINVVPSGTFKQWMKARGKQGGQNKIPRLSNERQIINQILRFSQQPVNAR